MTITSRLLGIGTFILSVGLSHAAEPPQPSPSAFGHSVHGEAFDEGPRQAAYLMDGMPDLDFPVTTSSPEAQKFFNQGVGQLHGFWYFEAERSFRQVATLDTNCVMAYWGLAMANVQNDKRAKQFMEKAVKLTNGLPRREFLYLDSLAKFYLGGESNDVEKHRKYVKALEQIVEEFPDDVEAKTLLAFKVWENNGRQRISSHTATDSLAREVLAAKPLHPVHHARIHLWNYEADRRALESAARCGQGSPGIAHMWHMPGHTYAGVHRYADAAWQQEASARVDHAYMMHNRVLPDQIHNYAHNNEWLVRTFNHLGRVPEAIDLAKNLIELPRHPKFNRMDLPPPTASKDEKAKANRARNGSATQGRTRLLETLVRWELWDQLIDLATTMYLEPTTVPEEQARRAHALALAYLATGDSAKASQQMDELDAAIKRQRDLRHDELEEAEEAAARENKPDDQVHKAMADALQPHTPRLKRMQNMLAELKVHRSIASGETNELKKAVEQLKNVPRERLARLWMHAGETDKALEAARESVKGGTNQVHLLANYLELLHQAGKDEELREHFAFLRKTAAQASLDLPILQRLAPIARSIDLPEDWREPYVQAADVGERPPLDSLGPLRWEPVQAPEWSLLNSDDRPSSLSDYKGRPVLVVFYLGSGCVHCIEQLNAFAPKTKQFADAGISLLAIGTDSVPDLKNTMRQSKEGGTFPFPVLSDHSLATFKAYRAYDDFEQTPLHGAFLVDGHGQIRWQDISFEPFTDIDFLLAESKRLLSLSTRPTIAQNARPKKLLSPRAASLRN